MALACDLPVPAGLVCRNTFLHVESDGVDASIGLRRSMSVPRDFGFGGHASAAAPGAATDEQGTGSLSSEEGAVHEDLAYHDGGEERMFPASASPTFHGCSTSQSAPRLPTLLPRSTPCNDAKADADHAPFAHANGTSPWAWATPQSPPLFWPLVPGAAFPAAAGVTFSLPWGPAGTASSAAAPTAALPASLGQGSAAASASASAGAGPRFLQRGREQHASGDEASQQQANGPVAREVQARD
mmetsp:Transcript_92890/g.233999  ORF Transcript_92890/g.233999 Transcript_92890/m.233999 type:complete len:242 (-) Transcript_92890:120-845(-)